MAARKGDFPDIETASSSGAIVAVVGAELKRGCLCGAFMLIGQLDSRKKRGRAGESVAGMASGVVLLCFG
jgi:hypothetical protein